MPYDGLMFRRTARTPPPVGRPKRNKAKAKAARQARKRSR